MEFTLIICTYKRAQPLLTLLQSVVKQTLYPSEIIIVDGSPNQETQVVLDENNFKNVHYFHVSPEERGLTKQRNFGIKKVNPLSEYVCFLDDDTVLEPNYFQEISISFENPTVTGVGGIALNELFFEPIQPNRKYQKNKFYFFDGYVTKEDLRNRLRNLLKLQSDAPPGCMPEFSHGRTCGFPLSGKSYEVDLVIGMSMAFRKIVYETITFSTYFEGYGLYEDADFSIRAQQFGTNIINTKAHLYHYHNPSGRPNQYDYGKMVIRNGWYVWRVKYPNPSLKSKLKWHAIALLLTSIRATNAITSPHKKAAFTEVCGRIAGWWSLWFHPPKLKKS